MEKVREFNMKLDQLEYEKMNLEMQKTKSRNKRDFLQKKYKPVKTIEQQDHLGAFTTAILKFGYEHAKKNMSNQKAEYTNYFRKNGISLSGYFAIEINE